jgi:hypothetical protein
MRPTELPAGMQVRHKEPQRNPPSALSFSKLDEGDPLTFARCLLAHMNNL